jgi:hypothetical protein
MKAYYHLIYVWHHKDPAALDYPIGSAVKRESALVNGTIRVISISVQEMI